MQQNPVKDVTTPEKSRKMGFVLTNTAEKGMELPNEWTLPSTAPEGWWNGLPVGKITILVGGDESSRDDILTFAANI